MTHRRIITGTQPRRQVSVLAVVRRAALLLPILLLLAGCVSRTPTQPPPQPAQLSGLTVTFLDVGQGDATLLEWAGMAALIDGGPREAGGRLVAELRRRGIKRLAWVIASHPHEDHIGGLIPVFQAFPVDNYLDSGFRTASPVQRDLLRAVQARRETRFQIAEADRTIAMGEGLAILLFHPSAPLLENTESDANNNSIVGRLMYGKVRVLFTGDLQEEGRRVIYSHLPGYSQGPRMLRADILKVAHHGSHDGTDMTFLDYVRPRYAVISCAKGNSYGHPHREVLRDLQAARTKYFRTDLNGNITMKTDGETIRFVTARTSKTRGKPR